MKFRRVSTILSLIMVFYCNAWATKASNCSSFSTKKDSVGCVQATIDGQENACVWCDEPVEAKVGWRSKSSQCWRWDKVRKYGLLNACSAEQGWEWYNNDRLYSFNNETSNACKSQKSVFSCVDFDCRWCDDLVSPEGIGRPAQATGFKCWSEHDLDKLNLLEVGCTDEDGWWEGLKPFKDVSREVKCIWEKKNFHKMPFASLKCEDPEQIGGDWTDKPCNEFSRILNRRLYDYLHSFDPPIQAKINFPVQYIERINIRTSEVRIKFVRFSLQEKGSTDDKRGSLVLEGIGPFFKPYEGQSVPSDIIARAQRGDYKSPLNDEGVVLGAPLDHILEVYPEKLDKFKVDYRTSFPPPKDPRNPFNKSKGSPTLRIPYNLNTPRFTRSAVIDVRLADDNSDKWLVRKGKEIKRKIKGDEDREIKKKIEEMGSKWTSKTIGVQRAPPFSLLKAGFGDMPVSGTRSMRNLHEKISIVPKREDYHLSTRDALRIWWADENDTILGAGLVLESLDLSDKRCRIKKKYRGKGYERLCLAVLIVNDSFQGGKRPYINRTLQNGPVGFNWQFPMPLEAQDSPVILRLAFAQTSGQVDPYDEFEYYLNRMSHHEPDGKYTSFDNGEPLEVYNLIKDYFNDNADNCGVRLRGLCLKPSDVDCSRECMRSPAKFRVGKRNPYELAEACYKKCMEPRIDFCRGFEKKIEEHCIGRSRGKLEEDEIGLLLTWWKIKESYEDEPDSFSDQGCDYYKDWGLQFTDVW